LGHTFIVACLVVVALAVACGDDGGNGATLSVTASPSPAPTLSPGETPGPSSAPSKSPAGVTYTVQAGDTLYSIASRFGSSVDAIAAANGILDPSQIETGQVLVIPGGVPATAPPATQPAATETPAGGGSAQVIRYGDTSRKAVAFTFDAGSDAGYTVMILDTLKANGIRASFGMTGKWAETNPELLQAIVGDGHTLINHTYDHKSFTGNSTQTSGLSEAERWDELNRTEQIVKDLTGATTKPYFRPPYGDYDASVNEDVGALGYAYNVMWAVDSRGWTGIPSTQVAQRCIDLAEPGAIYVFHVGSASEDGPALQAIIDGLRAQGYAITDIPGVLE
jgi:peptidoglycan/xylan/chitin deacetylase (PgdA/CDA1 family)